ncbi:VOC family protein [Frigidibacter mobilis]|uniref:VOC metalloenzyme family protein n=1 Tax=Frigidibacter mobilis TaxID=1335048 RepID=A0A159Z231_9RHOB|nr:VOC family protein [Frigidibacter mobilis]AMY68148.1 VOC metalloenzyme family protein [Frigidibacter mobilis]
MGFEPYLHFQGNCAEAMAFYAKLFGASDLFIQRYREMPDAPAELAGSDLVMHSALVVGGRVLMASDFPPGGEGEPQMGVSISRSAPDLATAHRLFDGLAAGGAVIMPIQPTFWSTGFGMVRDRFGTHWMISGPAVEVEGPRL